MSDEQEERWPFEADGALEYQPIGRADTLVSCARCGAVIQGDVSAQAKHRIWHGVLRRDIADASRPRLPERFA